MLFRSYNISGLPANAEELGKMIQAQGAVFNSYAEGAFNGFMQKGHPELITKDQYESWVSNPLFPVFLIKFASFEEKRIDCRKQNTTNRSQH